MKKQSHLTGLVSLSESGGPIIESGQEKNRTLRCRIPNREDIRSRLNAACYCGPTLVSYPGIRFGLSRGVVIIYSVEHGTNSVLESAKQVCAVLLKKGDKPELAIELRCDFRRLHRLRHLRLLYPRRRLTGHPWEGHHRTRYRSYLPSA
jgi:hypothetical protein